MGLLERIEKNKITAGEHINEKAIIVDEFFEIKNKIHSSVINEINKQEQKEIPDDLIRKIINQSVDDQGNEISKSDKNKILEDVYNDIMGYGPIEELLKDPDVSEIMVNGPNKIFIEKKGKIFLTALRFRNDEHVLNVIDRIVSLVGRHIDEASPMVDARLKDGSRVNAIIPPISLVGPILTIRKFSKKPITYTQLIDWGSACPKMLSFLEACVKGKLNIIVAGGTGSGKTTLLNVLSAFIPHDERIVTIEDAAELQLHQEHLITLESRPSNLEGSGQINIRALVKNALRMRPDRIIVGEVRSGEALDMLQAMNTGHDGSLTTTHANTPRDTISRLETMVMMAGMELPLKAIREQICSAVNLIVQQSRLQDGSRKITNITELTGMEGDIVSMQDIFVYETKGDRDNFGRFKGEFRPTGIKPKCLDKIIGNGVAISNEWFR
ncbi:MAG: type II secretion system protein E [Clostridiales bacterium GWF2_36_10]|nr:MAG: type II secretion system protein E [Clostridiales bacterium GWF2_36_10]HAN20192.1 type II secretion system protein E [Clostridiales bacterium]